MKWILFSVLLLSGCSSAIDGETDTQIEYPDPIATAELIYPPGALSLRLEGWVHVSYSITEEGDVAELSVVDHEPLTTRIFNDSCMDAVSQFKYAPRPQPFYKAQYVCRYHLQ